jgi:PAS domain S-box-containing protein
MSGEPAMAVVGRYLDEVAAESVDGANTLECIAKAIEAGAPVDSELETSAGGRTSTVSKRVNPLFDAEGRCYRVIVRTTDVTERRMHDAMINRLGRVIDGASDEIYIIDAIGLGVIQTNVAARRNLGLSEQEAASLDVARFLVEPSMSEIAAVVAPLLNGETNRITIDGKLRRKDGSIYPVEADVQYISDEQPPVLLATARDVTERRALQASLSRMAAIVESSIDAVIGLDQDGTVGHWNPAATALFGYDRAQAVGRPLGELLGGGRWHEDGLEALARQGGTIDTTLTRRNGETIDVSLTAFPVRDPEARPLGTAIIAHDIRWRLEATQALRESESRFRSVFDQAPSGILIQRASDGAILDINQYLLDIVEFSRPEILGNRPISLGLVSDPEVVLALDADLQAGKRTTPRELHIVTRSGRKVEMFTTVERIELNGEPCFLSFLADISQLRRAERELVRAQEGLRSITENLPLILTSWDNSEVCTLAVGHGLELAGLDGEALIGRHMSEIVGPSARPDMLIGSGRPGDAGSFEFSLAGRIFESQYRVLRDGSGTVSVAVDVTEERATLGQLDTIVENAPITLFALDPDGIVTLARGRDEGVLAFSPSTAQGRSVFDLLPPGSQITADVRRALGGEQFSGSYQTQSGRHVDVHFSPVRTADGAPAGAAAVVIDVTERLRAERALRESNERFRQIAETATDGIVSTNIDGRIVFANAALSRIFGYNLPEMIGQPLTILMPHELASAHRQGFRRYVDTGERVLNWNALELTGRRRDGTDFQFEMSLSEGVHDGDRVVTAFVRDITERRRTEEALMQAQKLESLGILAGGIAHDFNNMLVAIMGNAGLALADLPPESPAYETVQEIELAARRAAELARQMLAYSGKGRLAVSRLDLTALVREIPHLLRTSIGKGVNLRYDLAEHLPVVEADATQLRQVAMNLVINASDAIGNEEGVIAISTGVVEADPAYLASTFIPGELKPGTYCYLEVADTGSGMAPETLARIFDPFFTTKFSGKGLGLAAVLGIVRGHRGTLKVESAPGQGTTFRMLLPVAQGAVRIQPQAPAPGDVWKGAGLVLVVDDEESVRNVTARAVRTMGFEPVVAVDGQDGLEQFGKRHQEIALVLMDLTMPRPSGEAAADRMREIDPTVPIVLMSGFDESEMATRFRAAGVSGFVQKPFEIRTLRDAIRAAVSQAR